MKRIKIVIALLLGLVFIAPAQTTFYKQYDLNQGSAGYSLQPTDDGGAMIVGSTTVEGQGQQMLIMKTNETGDTLWTKTYFGQEGDAFLECIRNTSDENYIVSGFDYDPDDREAFVAKLDPEGDTLWTIHKETGFVSNTSVKSIIETYDNNYVFVYTFDNQKQRMVKINQSGEQVWEKQYIFDNPSYRTFTHVKEFPDHSLAVIGRMPDTTSGMGFTRVIIMKTNEDGDIIWDNFYAGEDPERSFYPNAMEITSDSGIVVTGRTTKYPPNTYPGSSIFHMKINGMGEQLWTNNYGTGLFEDWNSKGHSIIEATADEMIITGRWENSQGANTFLMNTTPTGEQQWMDTYLSDNWSSGYCVRQSDEEHLMVTGASGNKLIFLKTNMDGEITSSPSPLAKEALKVYPNPAGKKVTFICTLASGIHEGILELRNSSGVLIKRISLKRLNGEKTISTNRWAPGIYFYTLKTARGVVTGKLILAR